MKIWQLCPWKKIMKASFFNSEVSIKNQDTVDLVMKGIDEYESIDMELLIPIIMNEIIDYVGAEYNAEAYPNVTPAHFCRKVAEASVEFQNELETLCENFAKKLEKIQAEAANTNNYLL